MSCNYPGVSPLSHVTVDSLANAPMLQKNAHEHLIQRPIPRPRFLTCRSCPRDQTSCAPWRTTEHENWIQREAGQPVGPVRGLLQIANQQFEHRRKNITIRPSIRRKAGGSKRSEEHTSE